MASPVIWGKIVLKIIIIVIYLADKIWRDRKSSNIQNGFTFQILLFPEGTDLTANTKKRSDAHAEKYNLPKYNFVLHPRTTGFAHIVQEMKKGRWEDANNEI